MYLSIVLGVPTVALILFAIAVFWGGRALRNEDKPMSAEWRRSNIYGAGKKGDGL